MKNRMWIALIGALLICLLVGIGTMAFAEVDRTSYWIVANEGLEYDISVENYDSENSRVMIGGVVEFDKTLNEFVGVKSKMRSANSFTASLDYPYDSPGILIQKYSDPSCGLKLIPAPKSSDTEKEKWYICTSDGYYIKRTGLSTSPGIGYTTDQSQATQYGFEHRNGDGRQYVVYEYISSSNYVFLVSEEKKLKIEGTR